MRASIHRLVYKTRSEPLHAKDRAPERATRGRQRLNIMVVDDDPLTLRLYALHLQRWPTPPDLSTADNAIAALLAIGRKPPDMVVMDLNMPGIDGFSMLRILQKAPDLAHVKLVVVSGLDPHTIAERGGVASGIDVLPKPVPFDRLQTIADNVAQAIADLALAV